MKVIDGHLTAKNKAVVSKMIADKISQGKVGRTTYKLTHIGADRYQVDIYLMNRGLIECAGDKLRLSKYTTIIDAK